MSLKKWLPLLIVSPLVIAIDQVAKLWVVNTLILGETYPLIPVLAPYLQITRATNTGIAFGIGEGAGLIFTILPVIILAVLLWMYAKSQAQEWLQHIALAMVVGGAIGNIIDRLRLDHVIDFVHIYIPDLISNVSNFADHFIVIGVILLLLESFLQERSKSKDEAQTQTDDIIMVVDD